MKNLDYPRNLLLAITKGTKFDVPMVLSLDIIRGIEYALSTLSESEQLILQYRYAYELKQTDIAASFNVSTKHISKIKIRALKKLSDKDRFGYIMYGIKGYMQRRVVEGFYKGLVAGSSKIDKKSVDKVLCSNGVIDFLLLHSVYDIKNNGPISADDNFLNLVNEDLRKFEITHPFE